MITQPVIILVNELTIMTGLVPSNGNRPSCQAVLKDRQRFCLWYCLSLCQLPASFSPAWSGWETHAWPASHPVTGIEYSCWPSFKGCSRNYPGGPQALFCPVGGGCLFTCLRGGGVNLSWGSRRIWSIVGWGCPEGQGALTLCASWGWRGLKKNVAPPPQG